MNKFGNRSVFFVSMTVENPVLEKPLLLNISWAILPKFQVEAQPFRWPLSY